MTDILPLLAFASRSLSDHDDSITEVDLNDPLISDAITEDPDPMKFQPATANEVQSASLPWDRPIVSRLFHVDLS